MAYKQIKASACILVAVAAWGVANSLISTLTTHPTRLTAIYF